MVAAEFFRRAIEAEVRPRVDDKSDRVCPELLSNVGDGRDQAAAA